MILHCETAGVRLDVFLDPGPGGHDPQRRAAACWRGIMSKKMGSLSRKIKRQRPGRIIPSRSPRPSPSRCSRRKST